MLEIPQKLPSELISHILDWAAKRYRNGTTLRACALVSREWSPYAQRQLFRHITISTSRRSTEEWIQRLKTHSHLATFITNLTLCERTEEEAEAWTAELAEELGRILSRVRSFTLRSFYSTSLEEAEIERCHYRFFEHLGGAEGVHTLHVGWVRFETAKLMFQYLSKIPGNIIKLSLQEVGADSFLSSDFEDAGPITPNSFQGASRWALRSLTLASSQLREDVLSWLLGSVDLSGLQHLVLDCDEIRYDLVGDVVSGLLEKLMVTIGPSLRHLALGVGPGEEDIDNAHIGMMLSSPAMLSQLRSLEKITLISTTENLSPSFGVSLALRLLPFLPGKLQELVLAIDLPLYRVSTITSVLESQPKWKELDSALSNTEQLPNLRRSFILVEIENMIEPNDNEGGYNNQTVEVVRKVLPKTYMRGVLDIRAEEYYSAGRVKYLYHDWIFDSSNDIYE